MLKYTKWHNQAIVYVYRWLIGNLSLWSVISNVSSISNDMRTDTMKKEFSWYGYVCPYFK